MLPIIIDLILIIILAAFLISGANKGFILGISGIIIMIAAFYGARVIADTYSDRFKPMIEPIVSRLVDKSVTEASEEKKESPKNDSKDELDTVGLESLLKFGLFEKTAQKTIDELKGNITVVGQEFKNAASMKITDSVTYILTFTASYLIITILLSFVLRLLNFAFRLPGLGFINGAAGFALGLVKGMLILFIIAWAMRYFGGVFPEETTDNTVFLKWLMSNNLLAAFFGV